MRIPSWLIIAATILTHAVACGQALEMKVVTEVRAETNGAVVARHETYFADGKVYDVAISSGELTVFDTERQAFILLKSDQQTAKRTLVPLDDLRQGVLQIQDTLQRDPQRATEWGLHAIPSFPRKTRCEISSPAIQYAFDLQAEPAPYAAIAFDAFTAWTARLNALDATGAPPFMRVAASGQIAERGMVPARVIRTLAGGRQRVVATHQYIPHLSTEDRERIGQYETQLMAAPMVYYAEYRGE